MTPPNSVRRTKLGVVKSRLVVAIGFARIDDRLPRRVDNKGAARPARLVTPQLYRKINDFSSGDFTITQFIVFVQDVEIRVLVRDSSVVCIGRRTRLGQSRLYHSRRHSEKLGEAGDRVTRTSFVAN